MRHTGRFWSAGGNMNEGPFFEPAHEVDVEVTIKRSRFIAAVRKVHSEGEARSAYQRSHMSGATLRTIVGLFAPGKLKPALMPGSLRAQLEGLSWAR